MIKFYFAEETHSHANSQTNLVLQIFSKCDLLQRNRTMLKNAVIVSAFKRNVRNAVYIMYRESKNQEYSQISKSAGKPLVGYCIKEYRNLNFLFQLWWTDYI